MGTAVYRKSREEIVCRFIPWYKTNTIGTDADNLSAAQQAWKDGDPNDPGFMNRLQAILRGRKAL